MAKEQKLSSHKKEPPSSSILSKKKRSSLPKTSGKKKILEKPFKRSSEASKKQASSSGSLETSLSPQQERETKDRPALTYKMPVYAGMKSFFSGDLTQKPSSEPHSRAEKSAVEPQDPSRPPAEPEKPWAKNGAPSDDTLLMCLETLSSFLGRSMSAAAFIAGLPLPNNRMTPDQFIRAAERADLSARLVQKRVQDISPLILPCVLLLEGDKACLLVSLTENGKNKEKTAQIILPETGRGVISLTLSELDALYNGQAIFARPLYRYDTRSSDLEVNHPQSWFWGTLWRFWPIYSKVFVAAVLINLFAIASPLFTMNVYDRVVPHDSMDTLTVLSLGIGIVFLFDFILRGLRVYFVDTAGKNIDILLASRIFEQVVGMKLATRPPSSGSFANQLREFETLREFFSSATFVALIDLPFVFLFIFIIWVIGGWIALVPLLSLPFIVVVSFLIHMPLSAWVRRSFREGAQKHALLVEAIHGLETLKGFGAEGQIQENWEKFVAQAATSKEALQFFASLAMNWTAFIQQFSYVLTVIVGVILISNGDLTMGGLIACTILSSRALAPLSQVVSLLTKVNQSRTALQALDKIINLPVERPKGAHFVHRPVLKGDIEFKDVTYSYPDQSVTALSQFTLHIKAEEKVGFVGRIGSGKSTIEKLLLNFYTPEAGTIKIDGIDIRQIDPADLRYNIGYVPQDIYLFYGTIKENITLGYPHAPEADILRASEISGVLDFVRHHPQGFDMPIGEGGRTLSGGQRQAIALARALLRKSPILLLDEPTAMMDMLSEARLVQRLAKEVQTKTLLIATHRLPLLRLVDRLVITDGGKVIADGPRDQVIKALSVSHIQRGS